MNKVISTRDVIFDEDSTFSGDISQLKDDLLHVNVDELATLLTRLDQTQTDSEIIYEPSSADEVTVYGGFESVDNEVIEVQSMDITLKSVKKEMLNQLVNLPIQHQNRHLPQPY